MPTPSSPQEVASSLLAEKGLDVLSLALLQSLWAGYGQICRIEASPKAPSLKSQIPNTGADSTPKDSTMPTPKDSHSYILKLIKPLPTTKRNNNEGHTRKILSYQIEQYFYTHLAPQMPSSIPVAKCLASINERKQDGTSSTTAMILTDLSQDFPLAGEKRAALTPTQALAALDWLSNFHGFWWSRVGKFDSEDLVLPPLEQIKRSDDQGEGNAKTSIWLNGGYTYLATRRSEFASLAQDDDSEWSAILTQPLPNRNSSSSKPLSLAESLASFLTPSLPNSTTSPISNHQTLIHGDVKSENLFTSASGEAVAFYDFQYVGLGLGVSDLAKFFTCSVPVEMLLGPTKSNSEVEVPYELAMQEGERGLLERYWRNLVVVDERYGDGDGERRREYDWKVLVGHWEVALVDWLRFQAGWPGGFWGNTEWLEARVRWILREGGLGETLAGV